MTSAMAWGVTQRLKSASGMSARFAGVSMVLGSTALTVIVAVLQFIGQRFSELGHSGLGSGIRPHAGAGPGRGGTGADVDDASAAASHQVRQCRPRGTHGAAQIDPIKQIPCFQAALFERFPAEGAGDVNQRVQSAKPGGHLVDGPRRGIGLGEVELAQRQRTSRQSALSRRPRAIQCCYLRARVACRARNRETELSEAAGDDYNFAL